MATPMQHPTLGTEQIVASPLNISGYPKTIRTPTPDAGADTDEVLAAVGYSPADLAGLRQKGVI